jgi:diadenosine tetraphosphate (Ap4A) HIT family hydrolase
MARTGRRLLHAGAIRSGPGRAPSCRNRVGSTRKRLVMTKFTITVVLFFGLSAGLLRADIAGCQCDPAKPETLLARECSLCAEAEKHPGMESIFFLKDISPRKPNRWLALPREHAHTLQDLSPSSRIRLWKASIVKAKELWGDEWGLAFNGHRVRTQCHAHVHIGKFLTAVENGRNVITVKRAEDIPVPPDDTGLWIHPVPGGLHVHRGEQIVETTLMR